MRKILIGCLFLSTIVNAQFTFKGNIKNYPKQRVVVKLDKSFDGIIIGNITTDASGSFSIPVKEEYKGIIEMSLFDAKKNFSFIADNTNIDFQAEINSEGDFILNNPGNTINKKYQDYNNYKAKNKEILPQLKLIQSLYNPNDEFYIPLGKEINRISTLGKPDLSGYPFLTYYIDAISLVRESELNPTPSTTTSILNHFKNAGEDFDTAGVGKSLLYSYLKISSSSSKTQAEWESNLDKSIEKLLEEVGEDTERGQVILATTINFLNGYDITKLANKYMDRAKSLTCEITPELKEVITINNSIKEGSKISDVKFTHKLDGKYSSLYDIKKKYKLVLVWASWCGHCQQEMPYVKQFYENFKKSDGEIIGLAVDYDEKDWKNAIKDLPWLNDSDLLYWDSKFVKEFNISGTPTLFLLDKDNKILKITSKISDISSYFK